MKYKVQVVIIEKENELPSLIQLKMTDSNGGHWQNVTGSVEEGESLETAARRELFEETGLSVGPLLPLDMIFRFKSRWGDEVEEHTFLALIPSPRIIHLSSEHQNFRRLPLGEVRPYCFHYPSNYEAFLKAKLRAQYYL